MFPAGLAGTALLLQRLSASILLTLGAVYFAGPTTWAAVASVSLAILLILGLFTTIAALAAVAVAVFACARLNDSLAVIVALQCINLVSLALLGAGAYSIDARLFGRRVVTLDRRPD